MKDTPITPEEPKKPLGPVARQSIIIVQNGDGSLEAWSNLKLVCNYYGWSYAMLTQRQLPTKVKDKCGNRVRRVYRLRINYGRTVTMNG